MLSASKIRVLLVIDTLAGDAGTEKQVAEIVRRIDKNEFDVHLACFEDSPRLQELAPHCRPAVFPLVSLYGMNGVRQMMALRRYIGRHGIDVVHTFMQKANIAGVLASRGCPVRAVVASRRNLGYWQTPFYRRLFRYLNRHTTRLVANSEGSRRYAIEVEGAEPARVDVLYNGVDMELYTPVKRNPETLCRLGVPAGARLVGIVANYRPVKDLGLFLRTAKVVAGRVPEAAFVLIGSGPQHQELARLAGELGIPDRVYFTAGQGKVADYLPFLSVACLTSHSEGFSNAILESMAAGLPVVATDVGGNSEAIEDGVTGFVVRRRDPEDMAEPIAGLLTDEAKRSAMGRAAIERCREKFEIGGAVRRLEEYYASLAGRPARAQTRSPRVSVIVPAYRATEYIAETLDSVFAQTYGDFEVVVVNDGCPDTVALERVLEPYLPRLVYRKQENRGLSGARNTGIGAARGEYVALLDADDLWDPRFLELQMELLECRPELDLVWCDSVFFGATPLVGRKFSEVCPSRRPVTTEALLTGRCRPIASCVVARRQAVLDAGGFDENLRRVEDFDMWIRLAHRGCRMDFRAEALGRRRDREGTLSSNARAQFETAIRVYRKFQSTLTTGDRLHGVISGQIRRFEADLEHLSAQEHFQAGRYRESRAAYGRALRLHPTLPRAAFTLLLSVSPSLALTLRRLFRNLKRGARRETQS